MGRLLCLIHTVLHEKHSFKRTAPKVSKGRWLASGESAEGGSGSVKSYAQKSKQAAKEKSRYAMEESPRATSRCFMFMYFLLPH